MQISIFFSGHASKIEYPTTGGVILDPCTLEVQTDHASRLKAAVVKPMSARDWLYIKIGAAIAGAVTTLFMIPISMYQAGLFD